MLTTLAVENYRSLRDLVLPLSRLTVVTGANGSGKSSLYRAMRLLADAARNGAVAALAREGGLPSTLWAGPETVGRAVREGRAPVQGTVRTKPVGLRLGFAGDEFGYALDLGLPVPGPTVFNRDPEIKRESIWSGPVLRTSALLADRAGPVVRARGASGAWGEEHHRIGLTDSMLSEFADPRASPEVLVLREKIRSWRFYDHFRTDAGAPARQARVGTRTPVLDHEGADLAAALQTITEIGDADALAAAIDDAFPGSRIRVEVTGEDGRFELRFRQHGLLRPLGAAELSDGTLRYLLWVAALLSPRPPELLVLNEPETSLHPDLLPALAALIATAAKKAQVVVVSHARPLVRALEVIDEDAALLELEKDFGATVLAGQERLDRPAWHWPKR
ncbi:AAA family ATPase [Allokutzneria sp. A3M-2-11 16]|uniref:AAA family ATPase n=1 Tax=Allokutzneria sp. A3M-2-11 16 TaxID=2962043 RepID=UPI0020B66477|nr:AAA family ATPase [Allokutzneria sp. A3M-2-11 16]MCP3805144.1 AAA family ATPase [Allokutzneria sp. A3M-2-11 16]